MIIVIILLMLFCLAGFQIYQSKPKPTKPLVKFKVDDISVTLFFEKGQELHKKFEGRVYKTCYPTAHRVFYYYETVKAEDTMLRWLQKNKESGFVAIDDSTLLPVEQITNINIDKSSREIELEAL